MSKNILRLEIASREKGLIITEEGRHPFIARIFADGHWHPVPLADSAKIGDLPLAVKWQRKNISPCWRSLRAVLTNKGQAGIKLGSFHMMEGNSLGTEVAEPVVFLDSAGGWFAGAVKGKNSCPPYMEKWANYFVAEEDIAWAQKIMNGNLESGAHHSLAGLMAYYRGARLKTWMLSFLLPMEKCSAAPVLLLDPKTGRIRAWTLINNFAGYELSAGESIATETVLLGRFDEPHQALETWAGTCAKIRKIKVHPRPPVGWLSWYGYRLTQNEADSLRTAELIKNEFAGLGFKYMQLDLGYNKGDLPGEWFQANKRYARGLKHISAEFAKKGFKLGLWSSPLLVAADSEFARKHPEALIPTHPKDSGKWYWEPHCRLFELDVTHPEGEKFLRKIIRHFKAVGVKYFKFDFMNRAGRIDPAFTPHDNRIVKGIEFYRRAQKIIMEELSPDDYVYWCSNLMHFGIGMGSTSMTAADIGNTGFTKKGQLEFFRQQASTTISRFYLHEKMLRLNADSLNVAPPADIEECRMRATLVAMSGGQMFLGDRFDLSKKDRFEIIRQVTPPYGRVARPVDLFEHVYPDAYPRIWHLPVKTGWDKRDLVALMNCERDMTIIVDFKKLGLSPDREYHLWEFWRQEYQGRCKGKLSVKVKCPSSRLLAIVPAKNHPWVLSTSFHFTQGAGDLAGVKWDHGRKILSGVLCRPKGTTGHIIIAAPPAYRCVLEEAGENVHRLPVTAGSARTPWQVEFKTLPSHRGD